LLGLVLLLGKLNALGEVEVVAEQPTSAVFRNGKRMIRVQFHNLAAQSTEANLRFRLYQASGSTLMPLNEVRPWKTLTLAAGQTVLESFEIELPSRAPH